MPPTQPTFFVSYRRSDSSGSAKLLVGALVSRYGEQHVFQDIDQINPGDDFPAAIQQSLESATVVIAVIGGGWRGQRRFGRDRIRHKNDWVRKELEIAANLPVSIVPVLVQGAEPLRQSDLPPSLSFLATTNATSLRSDRWDDDVLALMQQLKDTHAVALNQADAMIVTRRERVAAAEKRNWLMNAAKGAVLAAIVASAAYWFWPEAKLVGAVRVTSSPASSDAFDIGFWNLRRFSLGGRLGGRETLDDARIERIAQIIVDLDLDVYGLVEVGKDALERLKTELARKGVLINSLYQDGLSRMGLAAVFRRDRVQCQKEERIYEEHAARLREDEPSTGRGAFPRFPLFFSCDAARLVEPVNVTLVHFKSMYGGEEETSPQRQLSSIIIGEIVNGAPRSIVGGDFNAFPEEVVKLYGGLTDVGNLRRLFTPDREPYTWVGGGDFEPVPLDYIWASPDLPVKPVRDGAYAVIGLDEDYPAYRDEVSDHLPIVISVSYESR